MYSDVLSSKLMRAAVGLCQAGLNSFDTRPRRLISHLWTFNGVFWAEFLPVLTDVSSQFIQTCSMGGLP